MDTLDEIGSRSALTCPDCGGGLWELKDARSLRYRCHTGHAYTALSLEAAQAETSEYARRSSVRALREREMLLRCAAGISAATGDRVQAEAGLAQAESLQRQIRELVRILEAGEPPAGDAPA